MGKAVRSCELAIAFPVGGNLGIRVHACHKGEHWQSAPVCTHTTCSYPSSDGCFQAGEPPLPNPKEECAPQKWWLPTAAPLQYEYHHLSDTAGVGL